MIPARIHATKPSGGRVEFLLIERLSGQGKQERWLAMGRTSKGLRPGLWASAGEGALRIEVIARRADGHVEIEVTADETVRTALERWGTVPLPPYIDRAPVEADRQRYQTVYACEEGAIATPTAGLHFTKHLISALVGAGHRTAEITLHVGPGTFRPIQLNLDGHTMHEEAYVVSQRAAAAIAQARLEGRRIVAVGTTVVRTLESVVVGGGVHASTGRTNLFIRPPFSFRVVDDLITNFHLPRSTLLALVMAFATPSVIRAAYEEAILQRYRFYSYGDAMLIRGGQ